MMNELFFSSMTALLVCMALIPPLRLAAERFQVMDLPGERKVHEHPVPRVGGFAFAVGACVNRLVGSERCDNFLGLVWMRDYRGIRSMGRPCRS